MRAFSPPRVTAAPGPAPAAGLARLLRGLVLLTAGLYVVALIAAVVGLRFVGEGWWLTAAALYLPRFVLAAPLPVLVLALWALKLRRYLWTQVVAALVVLFPLMGGVISWPTSPKHDAPVVRLLSYNVNSGYSGYANIVEEVERYSPDIVFLQEIGSVDEIVARLKEHFATVRVSGQFVLATRYNIVSEVDPEKVVHQGRSRSPRFVQYLIETSLGPVAFYNVHPISPRAGLDALRSGGLRHKLVAPTHWLTAFDSTLLMADTGLRETQVQAFAQAAGRETLPVVVAGDTNLPGLSRIQNENLSGFQDGFAAVGQGFGYTFPTGRAWMRIDRVMASSALRFVGFQVGKSDSSDHQCVVADLQAR
jgi:vancomycin resistance protein VanJ